MSDEPISIREFFEARERIVRLEAQREAGEQALKLVADGFKVQIRALAALLALAIALVGLLWKGH